ncbi:hypothetical protein OUZ56_005155 [Daphnia magna]|uniref:Secreted protein n=1 Tax=Daphnia magna TaxID=35525 RepID=A0ABQ9YS02_9CRUS|nr:hypothetical protein OUZ56_005155 [Daphnia magna]
MRVCHRHRAPSSAVQPAVLAACALFYLYTTSCRFECNCATRRPTTKEIKILTVTYTVIRGSNLAEQSSFPEGLRCKRELEKPKRRTPIAEMKVYDLFSSVERKLMENGQIVNNREVKKENIKMLLCRSHLFRFGPAQHGRMRRCPMFRLGTPFRTWLLTCTSERPVVQCSGGKFRSVDPARLSLSPRCYRVPARIDI